MNEPDRTRTSRRTVLQGAAGLAALGFAVPLLAQPPAANRPPPPPGTRLIMLGTRGGPGVSVDRSESASAVVVDGVPYLIDCGYGTMRQLVASGVGFQRVSSLFLSHLHNDHTSDIAALLSHQWTGSKTTPTNVYGPPGTAALVQGAIAFFRGDVEIRTVDEGRTAKPEAMFFGHDVPGTAEPTQVLKDERVTIRAAENTHFPERAKARMAHRALSWRIDSAQRSIVFSGDTAYSDTIASNTELLSSKPNDALMFTFVRRSIGLPGVTRAHYAIKSSVTALEEFKTSMGFTPHPFPAMLRARPGMMTLLRTFKPQLYKRLTGQLE